MATAPLRQDTVPQSHPEDKQDRAENRMDIHTPSRWSARKRDIHSEQQIRDNPLRSDAAATDKIEEPSWLPNPVQAQFPADLRSLWPSEPEDYAAGVPAVIRSAEQLTQDRSVLRGSRTLMVLNQPHGVDCPSCAWPEPDKHLRIFEFCENGARSLGRPIRVSAGQSFLLNTPSKISKRSERWLGQQGRLTHPWSFAKERRTMSPYPGTKRST